MLAGLTDHGSPARQQAIDVGGNALTTLPSIILMLTLCCPLTNYSQSGHKKTVPEMILKNHFDSREQVFVKLYKQRAKKFFTGRLGT